MPSPNALASTATCCGITIAIQVTQPTRWRAPMNKLIATTGRLVERAGWHFRVRVWVDFLSLPPPLGVAGPSRSKRGRRLRGDDVGEAGASQVLRNGGF